MFTMGLCFLWIAPFHALCGPQSFVKSIIIQTSGVRQRPGDCVRKNIYTFPHHPTLFPPEEGHWGSSVWNLSTSSGVRQRPGCVFISSLTGALTHPAHEKPMQKPQSFLCQSEEVFYDN
jgi:hypothetical protein